MSGKLTKALVSLAFLALLIPAAGCDYRKGGSCGGNCSYTDVLLGFDWIPTYDTYETVTTYETYDTVEYYDTYYYDDYSYYGGSDYYYSDGYYDEYYWKTKRADKSK